MLLLYRRSIRILFFIFSCPFFWSLRNLCLIVLASHDCPTYHHFGCLWRGGILRIQRQSDAFFYLREQLLASHPDPKQTFVNWLSMLFTSQITPCLPFYDPTFCHVLRVEWQGRWEVLCHHDETFSLLLRNLLLLRLTYLLRIDLFSSWIAYLQ